jgi:hypothetical protein
MYYTLKDWGYVEAKAERAAFEQAKGGWGAIYASFAEAAATLHKPLTWASDLMHSYATAPDRGAVQVWENFIIRTIRDAEAVRGGAPIPEWYISGIAAVPANWYAAQKDAALAGGNPPEDEGYQEGGVVPRTQRALVHAGEIVGPIDFMAQALQHAIAGLRPEAASGLIAAMPSPAAAFQAAGAAAGASLAIGVAPAGSDLSRVERLLEALVAKDAGVTVAINGDILDSRSGGIATRVGGAIVRATLRNSPTDQGVGLRTGLREALGVR